MEYNKRNWILVPELYENGINIDIPDNMLTGIDRRFCNCIILSFARKIDEKIKGKIYVEDKLVKDFYILDLLSYGGGLVLGIPYKGLIKEYGHEYTIVIEGFVDTEGNVMPREEIKIRTLPKSKPIPKYQDNDNIALDIAREGIVLLKNIDNVLPLKGNEVLNLFGKGIWDFRLGMVGAGSINPRYVINLIDAIEEYSNFKVNKRLAEYFTTASVIEENDILEEAKKLSDVAVIVISRISGEFFDNRAIRGEYYLIEDEERLIKVISENFEKTIAIINTGYPIDVSWLDKYNIKAALYCSYPGMNGTVALVEILDGRVNPSGKLTDTWSKDYYDIPASKNFYQAINGLPVAGSDSPYYIDTVYEEGIYVGYKYFETFSKEVAYPFGHGLSYTEFEYYVKEWNVKDEKINLVVSIKNIGKMAGKEVIQIYITKPDGKIEKPKLELVSFSKTKLLAPNEEEQLFIQIPFSRLASYDEESASWLIEKGSYTLWFGNSIKSIKKVCEIMIDQDRVVKKVKNRMKPPVEIKELSKFNPETTFPTGKFSGIKEGINEIIPKGTREQWTKVLVDENPDIRTEIKWSDIVKEPHLLIKFIKHLSIEELARLSVCAGHGWGPDGFGEAGRVYKLNKYDMPDFIVADGNCSVKVKNPNIGLPATVLLCQTWNIELAYKAGEILAKEAKENGVDMILAPAMNIHRNPLCGRHPEYFSEDPYLAGTMAGYFGKGLEDNGVLSCYKHVVANNCESSRKRNHSLLSERALREIYLRVYEYAMEINKPAAIMTAYNAVNGVYCACDPELIEGIFREEFGFEGFVMTDWGSYDTADIIEALNAGNCWLTPGSKDDKYVKPILEAVKEGKLLREKLESNLYYLLRVLLTYFQQ